MQAIITNGEIIQSFVSKGGIEVGEIPKGVPVKFLRYNGKEVVNLITQKKFWVDKNLQLHVFNIDEKCQLVEMSFGQRKDLVNDNSVIRLKTEEEKTKEIQKIEKDHQDKVYKQYIKKEIGSEVDVDILNTKLFCLLVMLVLKKDSKLEQFFQSYIDKYEGVIDFELEKNKLLDLVEKKSNMF